MKRFQPGLKREARPQRHGGEEADWGLQIKNKKSSNRRGGRKEQAGASRGRQQRHQQRTPGWGRRAGWGDFEIDLQRQETEEICFLMYV